MIHSTKTIEPVLIVGAAIIISGNPPRLIVGDTWEICEAKREKYAPKSTTTHTGFITSEATFVLPEEAGTIAYRSRQTSQLIRNLSPNDII